MIKQIEISTALIIQDHKIFAAQRGYGSFKGLWEFPGGKIEEGETRENALIREIQEELIADISIDQFFATVTYRYPDFHLTMHCFLCTLQSEHITLAEHTAAKWLTKEELDSVEWLPANISFIKQLKKTLFF